MSEWSERMAAKAVKQMSADRDESYAVFLREMVQKLASVGAHMQPSVEETMHRSYDIGYTDALNAMLARDLLMVEKLI